MPDDPQPDAVNLPDLDAYPMTKTEWAKFHRIITYGNVTVGHVPVGVFDAGRLNSLVLKFTPPLTATFRPFHGAIRAKGEITHARLSSDGLDLRVKVEGESVSRGQVPVSQVVSVEQVV
jgi:hypothetical protein